MFLDSDKKMIESRKNILPIIIGFLVFFLLGLLITYFYMSDQMKVSTRAIPDRNYFPHVHSLFQGANHSIHIVMFTMSYYPEHNDSEIYYLLKDLIDAKNRGVEVKVILEGGEEFLGEDFTGKQKVACRFLQGNDIEVRFDPIGVDTHAKLLIIDDEVIVGSTNWNYYALEKNHEASVRIKSRLISSSFESYFWNLWKKSKTADCEPIVSEGYNVTIGEVLLDRDSYDEKTIKTTGMATEIKKKKSKVGNDYYTFKINSEKGSLKVFSFGSPEFKDGDFVTVVGKYRKEKIVSGYRYYDEIEADKIIIRKRNKH